MKQVFYAKPLNVGDVVELDEKTAHHLFDVTRTTSKETVRIVDCDHQLFYGHVQTKPWIEIVEKLDNQNQGKLDITLCAALIKADKWEWMLQKATELGVSRIVPFTSKNTMIQIEPKKAGRKLERWQAICQGACQQSNRTDLVQIEPICTIQELDRYKSQMNVCAWEKEAIEDHICCTLNQIDQSVTFVIGPEGGITAQEATALEEKGFVLCSLGENILRAETAACYDCATAQYAYSTNLAKKLVGKEIETKEIQ